MGSAIGSSVNSNLRPTNNQCLPVRLSRTTAGLSLRLGRTTCLVQLWGIRERAGGKAERDKHISAVGWWKAQFNHNCLNNFSIYLHEFLMNPKNLSCSNSVSFESTSKIIFRIQTAFLIPLHNNLLLNNLYLQTLDMLLTESLTPKNQGLWSTTYFIIHSQ